MIIWKKRACFFRTSSFKKPVWINLKLRTYHLRLITSLSLLLLAQQLWAADIYVSPSGNDQNEGTETSPYASLDAALRKARELRRLKDVSVQGGINILVSGGNYDLEQAVFVRPEDSGTAESPTVIKALGNGVPVLSGGMSLKNWRKAGAISGLPQAARGKVFVTDAPSVAGAIIDFRQLWVKGVKAVRSKSTMTNKMDRILSWDRKAQTCWIPVSKGGLTYQPGMEMLIHQWWAIANLRIKSVEVKGDSAKLSFMQPESKVQSEHPWPAPWISAETGNSAFFLTNSLQFLNEPGEWYLDKTAGKVYYWPREGERLQDGDVTVPVLETLVKIQGTIDDPVRHISFEGIAFRYASWLRPSQQGHVPLQAGMYLLDAYKLKIPGTPDKAGLENQAWVGRPAAAVEATYTEHTAFEACRFEHLASTGLDYKRGNHHDVVRGNLFKDIGGTAINVGVFSDEAFEAHLPYNPSDWREVSSNTLISNNLITNVTNEDWGCVGIGAGFVKGIQIKHNEISEVSYSGVSVGWGWTKSINAMSNNHIDSNKIHHYAKHMYDVAAVYTLSAQPGSTIIGNYVDSIYVAPYAHLPEHWFYLYTDEGTSYYTVKNNWCPGEKFLQNANGPNNAWENNGPMVADSIRNSAGIQKKYDYLLKERISADSAWQINKAVKGKE